MPVQAFIYHSDDGNAYQAFLPSEYATAFGYESASGAEPALPSYCQPRYATYVDTTAGIYLQAVITTAFSLTNPPQYVAIGGLIYVLKSTIGETRNGNLNPNVMLIGGPQGPQGATGAQGPQGNTGPQGPTGPSGVLAIVEFGLTSDVSIPASSLTTIFTVPSLASGSYFGMATLTALSGASAGRLEAELTTTGSVFSSKFWNAGMFQQASQELTMALYFQVIANGGWSLLLQALSGVAYTAKATTPNQGYDCTGALLVKYQ